MLSAWKKRVGLGTGVVTLGVLVACIAGPGSDFVKRGDEQLKAGAPADALALYDEAEAAGLSPSRLSSRRSEAEEALVGVRLEEAESLRDEGNYIRALETLIELRKEAPTNQLVAEALKDHTDAWLSRSLDFIEQDDRAGAERSLDRLEAIYPDAPGLRGARAALVNNWTEVLLNRARGFDDNEPALSLLNWAILAAFNPDEPYFAQELRPLRQRLLESLSVPVALYMGSPMAAMDDGAVGLRNLLGNILATGGLQVQGVSWVERPFSEGGPQVTVAAVGEIASSDVARGPGVYRILEGKETVQNPDYLAIASRTQSIEQELRELSRLIDRYQAGYRLAEGPSRAKMADTLNKAQGEYDAKNAELYDLNQELSAIPPVIEQARYTELPIEDEVHSRWVEVTLELKVGGHPEGDVNRYFVGRGEEADSLRMADPGRGIPEDPLEFKLSDDELRRRAILDALSQAGGLIAGFAEDAAAGWLAHGAASEEAGDKDEAARAYVNHVLLANGSPGSTAVRFLARQGLPSPRLILGDSPK